MRSSSRGFTLVEMLIGLVLLGLVTTTIYRILTTNQRLSRAQTEQVSLQSSVRTGALVVASELREIGINIAGGTDILAMSSSGITYRAMRSTALACQVSATEVRLRLSHFYSSRQTIVPVQDALLLFVEGDSTTGSDDTWITLPITAVNMGSTCGAAPAVALTTLIATPLTQILLDAPARTFEVMELGIINTGGLNWLGVRSVSSGTQPPLQPALGPIMANGLELSYLNFANNPTASMSEVRSIDITIRGETDRTVRAGGVNTLALAQDSLSMRITLRNAPHP